MEFLNPGWLWGALALSLPVILHFWHRKRGKELAWAATRWLSGPVSASSTGIRLENILLLILRCLLLLLLVLFLSKPVLQREEQVHWIQPEKEVVENFRFELEEAEKRGEKRFWFNGEEVTDLNILPESGDLQGGINRRNRGGHIYLTARDNFTRFSQVYVPGGYTLNSMRPVRPDQVAVLPSGDTLTVLLENEEKSILAALQAITEVHSVYFDIQRERKPGQYYALSFTHLPDSLAGVNVVSGDLPLASRAARTLWFPDSLKPETSDVVFNGDLPAILLEVLAREGSAPRLSENQLRAKFERRASQGSENRLILVLFILVLCAERLLSTYKNA